MSLFEILRLRSEWENLAQDFKLSNYNGTIDNLNTFIENGIKDNRFRKNFNESLKIAKTIVEYYGSMESISK